MHYLIAGGGDFGTRYLRKLNIARKRRNLPIESITVIDNNPNCKAKKFVEKIPRAQIEVADLLEFGNAIWLRRNELKDATWVPAPIAPHIFAHWMKDKLEKEYKVKLTPLVYSWDHVKLPFIKSLPDGRLLLSHAPGMCPVNCTEPADCAITKGPRWWEMKNTIKEITTNLPQEKSIDYVAMLFGEHHYGVDGYGVGGIPMNSIYNELDKLSAVARTGKGRIGVATTSSCHAVVTLFEIQNLERNIHHRKLRNSAMNISARNQLRGRVKRIEIGAVNAEVLVELSGGVEIVSIITKASAEQLNLTPDKDVYAVIKASDVMIGTE